MMKEKNWKLKEFDSGEKRPIINNKSRNSLNGKI